MCPADLGEQEKNIANKLSKKYPKLRLINYLNILLLRVKALCFLAAPSLKNLVLSPKIQGSTASLQIGNHSYYGVKAAYRSSSQCWLLMSLN